MHRRSPLSYEGVRIFYTDSQIRPQKNTVLRPSGPAGPVFPAQVGTAVRQTGSVDEELAKGRRETGGVTFESSRQNSPNPCFTFYD